MHAFTVECTDENEEDIFQQTLNYSDINGNDAIWESYSYSYAYRLCCHPTNIEKCKPEHKGDLFIHWKHVIYERGNELSLTIYLCRDAILYFLLIVPK